MVVAALATQGAPGTAELCMPSCYQSGVSLTEGTKVADPTNCLQYYVCSDPGLTGDNYLLSKEPLPCEEGMYFNPTPGNGREPGCYTVPEGGLDGLCEMCDPCAIDCSQSPGALIPDPLDCRGFYHCTADEVPPYFQCLNGTLFDFASETCLPEGDAICFTACDPCSVYCVKEGRMPNPRDCTSYHYCEPRSGVANFSCEGSQGFSPLSLRCEEGLGLTCQPSCPADNTTQADEL